MSEGKKTAISTWINFKVRNYSANSTFYQQLEELKVQKIRNKKLQQGFTVLPEFDDQ